MKPWKGIRRFFVKKAIEPQLLDPESGGGVVLPLFLDRGRVMLIMTLKEAGIIRNMLDQVLPPEDASEERPSENNGVLVAELD